MNDGVSAFPLLDSTGDLPYLRMREPGMSLRDYLAAAALQGLLAGAAPQFKKDLEDTNSEHIYQHYSICAYRYADAMLAQRSKAVANG